MTNTKLKNYTTTVPASKSIGEILGLLQEFGADEIMLTNKDKKAVGLSFSMVCQGQKLYFSVPANIDKCHSALWDAYINGKTRYQKEYKDLRDQAEKVAWRILRDWVHAQLSIVSLEMVEIAQVFMGNIITDLGTQKTLYDRMVDNRLKLEFKDGGQ